MQKGVPVYERLRVSPNCALILPSHVALDRARERASGANAIGTTGRGIGPAYEDKVARRAVRVADLFQRDRLAARLGEMLDFHNFMLQRYFGVEAGRLPAHARGLPGAGRARAAAGRGRERAAARRDAGAARNLLFEGAQGALLDVDVGTYPFVTSSNTIAGEAAVGTGLGPRDIHAVLGIVKAYTTRVGAGPFPTELFDEMGEHLSRVGHEFGAVTGRPRRCGWFDAVALRRAVLHNSISSLGVTKLDVLDGLDTIRICTGYRIDGEIREQAAAAAASLRGSACRSTRRCPAGASRPPDSRSSRACRRMPDVTSRAWRSWPACRSTSSRPVPIAPRPSFSVIPSTESARYRASSQGHDHAGRDDRRREGTRDGAARRAGRETGSREPARY